MTESAYQIKAGTFEGPLDLLLSLIAKHEIDIYDISIHQITEEYLSYIEQMKEFNLEIASEFLLLAATLLEIKSAGLLPLQKEEIIDELTPEQVKRELIKRLINYRKFKNASELLEKRLEKGLKYHPRNSELEERFLSLMPDFTGDIDCSLMAQNMVRIIQRHWLANIETSHITPIPYSIDDQIDFLQQELNIRERLSFKEVTGNFSRTKVIVTFLAILELYKKGMVDINQADTFGDIEVQALGSRN